MIYTSQSSSLAVREFALNYRRAGWIPASVLGRAVISDGVPIETVEPDGLPRNGSNADAPVELREIGGRLAREATVALAVPSAIIQEKWNYLLNLRHPDFARLLLGRTQRFYFDR